MCHSLVRPFRSDPIGCLCCNFVLSPVDRWSLCFKHIRRLCCKHINCYVLNTSLVMCLTNYLFCLKHICLLSFKDMVRDLSKTILESTHYSLCFKHICLLCCKHIVLYVLFTLCYVMNIIYAMS